jgi:nitroreductase
MQTKLQKPAETQYAIHDLITERWSPRAFSSRPVEQDKLLSVFEAARWAASGGNRQPWTFIIASKEDAALHEKLVSIMTGRNPDWARNAPVLVLSVAQLNPRIPVAGQRYPYYDVGQAAANMAIQAEALGLHVHQMAGFDANKARELFEIPEGYEPLTIIAIGYQGDLEDLPEDLREHERLPRTRKPLSEMVYAGRWNQPLALTETQAVTGD